MANAWVIVSCFLCVLIALASNADDSVVAWNVQGGTSSILESNEHARTEGQDCTDLARDEEALMVFSTLGGGLTAVDPLTSEIRWIIADEPPIVAKQQKNVHAAQYLPDPRDGSIYQLGDMGGLKKLPYTIPQLVASAPCRSADGILYSGKKSDTWFLIDPKTGRCEKMMSFDETVDSDNARKTKGEKIGWATSRAIYLGRTQYTVMMYDSSIKDNNSKPWNITFYDYNSHTMAPDISNEYESIHLTTTSNGNIMTLSRQDGKFLWKKDLRSPVVAAFLLGREGLLSVPFTTVSQEAFDAILEESQNGNVNTVRLFQSLYVGEHQHGLYALPSLVDKNTPRISTDPPIKLLDGPKSTLDPVHRVVYVNNVLEKKHNAIIFGYYDLPSKESPNDSFRISPPVTKDHDADLSTIHELSNAAAGTDVNEYRIFDDDGKRTSADVGVQTDAPSLIEVQQLGSNAFNRTRRLLLANGGRITKFLNEWFMEHPSGKVHQMLIVIVLFMVGMFWYMCNSMRELRNQSENSSKTCSATSRSSGMNNANYEELVDMGDGHVRVGKIAFNVKDVLGKGCEGTFVFKGTFEERCVAVKRVLPECFSFADREVALLRESDAHENVVRYFCTEKDRQFRYIAVELCAATLQDYTESEISGDIRAQIDVWEVMRQAAAGLNHLHSLNIVHRDIKPQNVLLSFPDVNGSVRVMISDFGLCKKLKVGRMSFSRRSGITGTEGWIAPEMMRGERTTTKVDIFSLGCVYYYMLSGGQHAFGDAIQRQANILMNTRDLSKMKENTEGARSKMILAEQLIADMLHMDPQRRPPALCIANHPLLWTNKKVLAFLQDASDRVEKLKFTMEPLLSLEKNGERIVMGDWKLYLDPLLKEELSKFRGYTGASVRDLLRALRNKKHHYHDLSVEVKEVLGSMPYNFTNYWISRFPYLLSHSYHALRRCANEAEFRLYYNSGYTFTHPDYFDEVDTDFSPLLQREAKNRFGQMKLDLLGMKKEGHQIRRGYQRPQLRPSADNDCKSARNDGGDGDGDNDNDRYADAATLYRIECFGLHRQRTKYSERNNDGQPAANVAPSGHVNLKWRRHNKLSNWRNTNRESSIATVTTATTATTTTTTTITTTTTTTATNIPWSLSQ